LVWAKGDGGDGMLVVLLCRGRIFVKVDLVGLLVKTFLQRETLLSIVCGVTVVDASSDDEKPVVTIDTWLTQAEVKTTFECQEVTSNGYTYPGSVISHCCCCFFPLRLNHTLFCAAVELRFVGDVQLYICGKKNKKK